jgi:hypothetical protein
MVQFNPAPFDKEKAMKWVEALRSGEYTQAQNVLRKPNTNEMCCLGVLCDLYTKENADGGQWANTIEKVPANKGPDVTGQPFVNQDQESYAVMPPGEVKNWSGLGLNRYDSFWGRLAEQNDAGATFNQIADLVEAKIAEVEEREKTAATPTS